MMTAMVRARNVTAKNTIWMNNMQEEFTEHTTMVVWGVKEREQAVIPGPNIMLKVPYIIITHPDNTKTKREWSFTKERWIDPTSL